MRRLLAALALATTLGLGGAMAFPAFAYAAHPAHAAGFAEDRAGFAQASDDLATAFDEQYVLNDDGSVDITQTITWQFPSGEARHGIDRNVQVRAGYQNREDEYRYYSLSDVSVTSPTGAPTDISVTDFGAYKRIRIGSPSQTVSGSQKYVVKFHLDHYVNDIGDGTAEFYWNTVSTSNYDTYRNVTATLQAPAASTKVACFYGERGSTDTCDAAGGAIAQFAAPEVAPGEGMSVLASFPRTAFTGDLGPDLRKGSAGSSNAGALSPRTASLVSQLAIGLGGLLPLLALAGMGALVWQRGRDEMYAGLTPGLSPGLGQDATPVVRTSRMPMAAVQFNPPPGVQPGMVGTVIDETANVVDVTGTLIDLAVRGYLTLEKIGGSGLFAKDDWVLRRASGPTSGPALAAYEQSLLDGVFATGDEVTLSSLKNRFATTLKSVQSAMYDEVVARGWFRRSPQSQRSGWVGFGTVLMVLGVVGTFWIGGFLATKFGADGVRVWPLGIGLVLTGLIVRLLGARMAARTADGTAVLVQARGFEEYLKTAEAGQIRWEEAQDTFSRYLPYAIVFGVAERWAKVFQDVASAAEAAGHQIVAPIWWVGPWDSSWGFGGLASSMDDFSTTAAGTFVSTPGSSGSSGFSSGGGFSGGGGGGSSGGSW